MCVSEFQTGRTVHADSACRGRRHESLMSFSDCVSLRLSLCIIDQRFFILFATRPSLLSCGRPSVRTRSFITPESRRGNVLHHNLEIRDTLTPAGSLFYVHTQHCEIRMQIYTEHVDRLNILIELRKMICLPFWVVF